MENLPLNRFTPQDPAMITSDSERTPLQPATPEPEASVSDMPTGTTRSALRASEARARARGFPAAAGQFNGTFPRADQGAETPEIVRKCARQTRGMFTWVQIIGGSVASLLGGINTVRNALMAGGIPVGWLPASVALGLDQAGKIAAILQTMATAGYGYFDNLASDKPRQDPA